MYFILGISSMGFRSIHFVLNWTPKNLKKAINLNIIEMQIRPKAFAEE